MKRRLLATFLSLCLLVGLLPTVALAADEEPFGDPSPVCTCAAFCTEETADKNCSVCAEDYTLCAYVVPDGKAEPTPCTKTKGCVLKDGHEGACITSPNERVCADLEGCAEGSHAKECPLYVEPTHDTPQDQAQNAPIKQPITSPESTADLFEGTGSSSTYQKLEGAEGSDLTWSLTNDGVLTILGTGAMKDYGYSGRTEVPWYDQRGSITKVVFGAGVTHIGSFAFYQHTALTSFEMADSVVSFGPGAFQGCSALTTIPELHANFQDFSTEVFVDANVSTYEVDAGNPYYTVKNGILYSKDGMTLINCPPGKTGDFCQSWLDGVTTIAPYAFRTCRNLTGNLVIPAHVTSIGHQAFQNCAGLTGDLTIPNTVTNLSGRYTFAGMSGMKGKLTLGSNITEIADGMFSGSNFTSMEWQGAVTSVGNNAFTNCKFTNFALPESLTTVGNYAFSGCSANSESFGSLEYLARIGDRAFANCQLSDITISAGATVGTYAFTKATLGNIIVSENVTIGNHAFNGATITSVDYSASMLPDNIFQDATISGTVTLSDSVTDIGDRSLIAKDHESFSINASLANIKTIGSSAFRGATFTTDISIPSGATVDSNAFDSAKLKNVSYNTETVSYAAFRKATMDSLTLGVNTKAIAEYAFQDSQIGGDVLKLGKVETIEKYAFQEAHLPATVIIPETTAYYNNHVFFGTTGGKTLLVYGSYQMVPTAFTHGSQFETVLITADIVNNDDVYYGDGQDAHNRLTSMVDHHIIYMINDTSRTNAEVPNNNGAVGVTNGGIFAENTQFEKGKLAVPTKDGAIFDGWYTSEAFTPGTKVDDNATITDHETYYAKWIGMEDIRLQYGGEQTISVSGVTLSGYQSDDLSVATVSQSGKVTATGIGTATISATGTYNGQQTTFKTTVTVIPRVLAYTLTDGSTGSGSISYNYSSGHHALSDSLTFKWKDNTNKTVTLTEGADIDYTYAVSIESGGDGTTRTYDYLPMPVGEYQGVTFNLLNENYTFALSDGSTRNHLEIDVNVVDGDAERAYLASAAPKADQNFVYTGQGVLPVEGTLNAYAADSSSSGTVDIGTFTVNIEGLNDTTFHSELSGIAAGTDLAAINSLTLPTQPGTYIITASAANDDYYLYKSLVFTINKATVTVQANDESIYVGETMPEFTCTVSGLAVSDTLVGTMSFTCEASDTSTAGTYAIIPSGVAVPDTDHYNREIVYLPGSLTILSRGGGGSSGGSSVSGDYIIGVDRVTGGKVTVSPGRADKGDTVTITVKPDAGYVLEDLIVTSSGRHISVTKKDDNKYTFTMPAGKVRIEPVFAKVGTEKPAEISFTDVAASDYYYDAVLWAVENSVTNGISATTFGPSTTVNRAQMVTFLWRAHGAPKATSANPFTDVSTSDYYYDAVLWAVANGVTNGTSSTTFSPNTAVSRAQAVTFQWRAAGSPVVSGSSFYDVAADAYYANAVTWAVTNGITNGIGGDTFSPDAAVSRAQAVTFLWRELDNHRTTK